MQNINDYLKQNKDRQLKELMEFLTIPSISAQSKHKADIGAAANWLATHLKKIGMEHAKVIKTKGHPIVYADHLKAKGKPAKTTVLIYGHYDVQSSDPLDQWNSEPFKPTVRNGNLYGRGTADDKGQLFTHLKALEAFLAVEGRLPVNVKFMFEGEEELGSAHLTDFVEKNKKMLSADICLISDSHMASPTQPLMEYGLRGIVYTQINLATMPRDAHSGTYGGNIPNPAIELANLITKFKDERTQKILIPGFYDDVRGLSIQERFDLRKSSITKKAIINETGVKRVMGETGFFEPERAGARPTLDINGMWSGYIDEGQKTIIPARASAKISMRLVPYQKSSDIAKKFTRYVKAMAPKYTDVDVEILSASEPILMQKDNKYFKVAEAALKEVFGSAPRYELQGGSIPVTATVKAVLGMDSVLMGFGLPDDGLHSPNEKLNLEMFYKGIECSVRFFQLL